MPKAKPKPKKGAKQKDADEVQLKPLERLKNSIVAYAWVPPVQLRAIVRMRDVRTYVVHKIIQQILDLGWLHVSDSC